MSMGIQAAAGGPVVDYRVLVRDGCTLIFGELPITHFTALASTCAKSVVTAPTLARLMGANMAWGEPKDIEALTSVLKAQVERAKPNMTALQRWLDLGERGASSDAIVRNLRGPIPGAGIRDLKAHPYDPDDLRRCIALLEAVPDLVPDLPRMRTVSRQWGGLIANWDSLVALFKQEQAECRANGTTWVAPKTYAAMKAAMGEAREHA